MRKPQGAGHGQRMTRQSPRGMTHKVSLQNPHTLCLCYQGAADRSTGEKEVTHNAPGPLTFPCCSLCSHLFIKQTFICSDPVARH